MDNQTFNEVIKSFDGTHESDGNIIITLERVASNHTLCCSSIISSWQSDPDYFINVARLVIPLLSHSFSTSTLEDYADWYADFTLQQNVHQRRYEKTGLYPCSSHNEADKQVYQNDASMEKYAGAMLMTEFLWPHHLEVLKFYREHFLTSVSGDNLCILEIAPGHGLLGRLLLEKCRSSKLLGVDISPLAIKLSRTMVAAPPAVTGAEYVLGDALRIEPAEPYDLIIAGEVLEHLDRPKELTEAIRRCLAKDGRAFVTAAITAAQMDHVTEFKSPGEVEDLIRGSGLEIESSLVAQPRVIRQGSTRVPRVMAAVLRHASH